MENNEFVTLRVKYRKIGSTQYFSHLDWQKTMIRVLTRTGLPLWYSLGFNPHPKITWGPPLPVGSESLCEYMDIRFAENVEPEQVKNALNRALTTELEVSECYVPEKPLSDIVSADYTLTLEEKNIGEKITDIDAFLKEKPLTVIKKDKETDVTEMLHAFSIHRENADKVVLKINCACGQSASLNPRLLLERMKEKGILFQGTEIEYQYRILREKVY